MNTSPVAGPHAPSAAAPMTKHNDALRSRGQRKVEALSTRAPNPMVVWLEIVVA